MMKRCFDKKGQNMKRNVMTSLAVVCSVASLTAAPEIKEGSVTMVQDSATRQVTISYTLLNEPAVVTVDIQTNGCSIGAENMWYLAHDVNKVVQPGARAMTWRPDKAWPNRKIDSGVQAVVTAWSTNSPPNYLVVSLVAASNVAYYTQAAAVPFGVTNDLYKTEYLVMRKCPAANVQWRMGSPTGEAGRFDERETAHVVTLADDYYMGIYEITQRQYELLMSSRPSSYKNDEYYLTRPVESVSYTTIRGKTALSVDWPTTGAAVGAGSALDVLRARTGIETFDLPLMAQWEFACRAGCGNALNNGKELSAANIYVSDALATLGRYSQNGGKPNPVDYTCSTNHGTAAVGSYRENAWGLYDMHGNVREWCRDWFSSAYCQTNPERGPETGAGRVSRGGSWSEHANYARAAYFHQNSDAGTYVEIGFRVVCGVIAK
jgi:formylglycine-generating enzyme required for sulfatase activity